MDKDNQMDNPCVWLPEPSWDNVSELDKLTNFHGIVMSFEQYSRDWNIWYTSAEPETSVIPGPFSQQSFYTGNHLRERDISCAGEPEPSRASGGSGPKPC